MVLFTRKQKVRELSLLSKFIYKIRNTEPKDIAFKTDLILPEALILKVTFKAFIFLRLIAC